MLAIYIVVLIVDNASETNFSSSLVERVFGLLRRLFSIPAIFLTLLKLSMVAKF